MKKFALLILFIAAFSTVGAAEGDSFMALAGRLNLEALHAGKGFVSEEVLETHADILFRYLEGEPRLNEKRHVINETKLRWEELKKDEVAICVSYDNGLVARGMLFIFRKDVGYLLGLKLVRGE